MTRTDEALRLLDERDAYMRTLGGCSDGGCIIVKPIGMHTNGGCKCSLDGFKMQRVMYMDNKTLDALRALLTQERDAWQDIATAPKDGSTVLLSDGDVVDAGFYHDGSQCYGHRGEAGFFAESDRGDLLIASNFYAQVWQPLPAPPRHDGKEKADG